MKKDNTELFERMPVGKAIIALVVPAIISQVITVVYNMADTFFIGQMNDPNQVAAAVLAMPPFVMLSGIANLFGIAGCSLISRCLGEGNRDKAKKCAAFSIWSSIAVALIYGLVVFGLSPVVLPMLGADDNTYAYCYSYSLWTVGIGSVPTVLCACLSHLVRAEGYSKESSFGIALGGILNIILDPILIFAFDMGVAGAAIATMFSNVISTLYFLILLYKNRDRTVILFNPRNYSLQYGIPKEILLVGIPSFAMVIMITVSNLILNKLVVAYSNQAIAGMGIAKKIDILAFAIANGMTQGVLPLIGYNYAAKNFKRMRSAIKSSLLYSIIVSAAGGVLLFTCAVPLIRFFIDDAQTIVYGQHFLRVISITCPAISVMLMIITIFQALGMKVQPLILSLLRKGTLDIPLMLIMDAVAGSQGIPWATPASDVLGMCVGLCLFIPFWKKLRAQELALTENQSA